MAMLRKFSLSWALVAVLGSGAALAAGSDPTVDQIYQAAQTGQLAQAEQMVGEVLQDHPRSGEAHYVAAEVYARAGDYSTARRELAAAETLEPGLSFARPQSVRALEAELAQGRFVPRVQRVPYSPYGSSAARPRSSRFWSLILVLIAGVVIVVALARRRSQPAVYPPQYPGQPGLPPTGVGPMGMGDGVVPPYPYGYGAGPGSGIMGSIGTGLAVGAGLAAGEALVNRVISGPQGGIIPAANAGQIAEPPYVNGDMGGTDFGVSDGGSWGDGGGDLGAGGGLGGGDDFGTGGGDSWT